MSINPDITQQDMDAHSMQRRKDLERVAFSRWKKEYRGLPSLNSTNKNSCLQEADRLKRENDGKGAVYYVCVLDNQDVYHAYYLPNLNATSSFALNHAENGYEGYPRLKVEEVIALGFPIPENVSTSQLQKLIQENW